MKSTIKRLKELEKKATPGPWTEVESQHGCEWGHPVFVPVCDVELIQSARNALPKLIGMLEEAAEIIKEHADCKNGCGKKWLKKWTT